MPEQDDALDALSSPELHDLAVAIAKRHLDVRFFYRLMKYLPTPRPRRASGTRRRPTSCDSARTPTTSPTPAGARSPMLRPFYLEYLRKHHVTPK